MGFYAILAADTRTTSSFLGMEFYDDDTSKVQKTTMGLITGAGLCQLLDAVKQRLAVVEITSTNDILRIMREERERARGLWRNNSNLDTWLRQTGWIFSYFGLVSGKPLLRLGMFHPGLSETEIGIAEIGKPLTIYPIELPQEIVEPLTKTVLAKMKVPTSESEVQASIEQNVIVIAQVISTLKPFCSSISNRLQVGIHRAGASGISGLTDIPEDGNWSLTIPIVPFTSNQT